MRTQYGKYSANASSNLFKSKKSRIGSSKWLNGNVWPLKQQNPILSLNQDIPVINRYKEEADDEQLDADETARIQ